MIAEITVEKKHQSRAFLILPVSFNMANFLGPGESISIVERPLPRVLSLAID